MPRSLEPFDQHGRAFRGLIVIALLVMVLGAVVIFGIETAEGAPN